MCHNSYDIDVIKFLKISTAKFGIISSTTKYLQSHLTTLNY